MTTSRPHDSANDHPSDGVLLALHDGLEDRELDVARLHVARCAACQQRMSSIDARATSVRESLASIPVPPLDAEAMRRRVVAAREARRAPRWRRPAFLAAAALIPIVAAASTSAVRHWIGALIGSRTSVVTAPTPSTPTENPKTLSGATVSFAPSGPHFTVRLDSLPAEGQLTVERTNATEISAQVTSGAGTGGDALLVLPGELRVRNTSAARASYTLSVPSTVDRLTVIVGGRSIFNGPPPARVTLTR